MPPTAEPAQQAPEAATERRQEQAQGQAGPMAKVVHLHTAHPRIPIPYVTPGEMFQGARARGASSRIPSLRKLTCYGLLGGMAVAGALEWPIAIAVGAATEVITREQAARKRAEHAEEQRRQPGTEPSARTEAAQPGQAAMA
ncbi:hypothetical protein [Streptomyces carpinensis]|nr:hypothetical protein [Streptomyces carpinensis]